MFEISSDLLSHKTSRWPWPYISEFHINLQNNYTAMRLGKNVMELQMTKTDK